MTDGIRRPRAKRPRGKVEQAMERLLSRAVADGITSALEDPKPDLAARPERKGLRSPEPAPAVLEPAGRLH